MRHNDKIIVINLKLFEGYLEDDGESGLPVSLTIGLRHKSVPLENIICQWANTRYARAGIPIHFQHGVPDGWQLRNI